MFVLSAHSQCTPCASIFNVHEIQCAQENDVGTSEHGISDPKAPNAGGDASVSGGSAEACARHVPQGTAPAAQNLFAAFNAATTSQEGTTP